MNWDWQDISLKMLLILASPQQSEIFFDLPADGHVFKEDSVICVALNHTLRNWVWSQRKARELVL